METKKDKKREMFAVRLDKDLVDLIENEANRENSSKSRVVRDIIQYYFAIAKPRQENKKSTIGKSMLKYLFECLNENQLEKFTEISTQSAMRDLDLIKGRIDIEESFNSSKEEFFEKFVENLGVIYGEKGLGWIENVEHDIQGDDMLYLRIVHGINRNFSRFFIKLMSNLMSEVYRLVIKANKIAVEELKIEFLLNIKLKNSQ